MQNWKPPSLLILLFLTACSNSGPVHPVDQVHPFETNAINAINGGASDQALTSLDAALARYQSLDNMAGRWRVRYAMASLALVNADIETASQHTNVLQQLAPQLASNTILYRTHIVAGRVYSDERYFQEALATASTPIEKAVAHTYLGATHSAIGMLEVNAGTRPDDLAFIYYQHAVATASAAYFQMALDAYKQAEDPRGVADALVNLAQLASIDNRSDAARIYAKRAVLALESVGQVQRARKIESWSTSL